MASAPQALNMHPMFYADNTGIPFEQVIKMQTIVPKPENPKVPADKATLNYLMEYFKDKGLEAGWTMNIASCKLARHLSLEVAHMFADGRGGTWRFVRSSMRRAVFSFRKNATHLPS